MAEDQATLEAMEPPPEDDYMDLSHIHPEKRTDLEIRKSQLMKEPDWNYYRPMERQSEIGVYDTGVPRARFKKMPDNDPGKMNQIMANYGVAPSPAKGRKQSGRQASPGQAGSDSVPKLPSLAALTPAQEAMEARPFLPPPSPDHKEEGEDEALLVRYKRVKYDLATLKKKAQIEIEAAQGETTKVRKKAAAQRELLAKQSDQIKDLTFQLQEMKRMQSQEEKAGAKKLTSHEKRAAALHHRLGELSHEHEQAMSAASAAMNDLQAERDALAMALAAVAKQAVGGEEAEPQSMSREISASVREGNDPLPHTPQSWLHFKYTDVSNVNKVMRSKKLAGDGVRAVAALVAQVRRLWRKRQELTTAEIEARSEVDKLKQIISRVDVEYQGISDSIAVVERAADRLRETRGMDVPVARDAALPTRMKTVQAVLHKLAAELDIKERDLDRTQAQMLERDFMHKLHSQETSEVQEAGDIPSREISSDKVPEKTAGLVVADPPSKETSKVLPVAEKKAAAPSPAAPADKGNDDGMKAPNLEELSSKDQAEIVEDKPEKTAAAPSAGAPADDNGNDDGLPNLEEFSPEDQAKIVKMQAQGRGYITRKHMAEKKAAAPSASAPAADDKGDELPNLEEFSAEDQAKIVKMQAQSRGYITRKHMAEEKAAAPSAGAPAGDNGNDDGLPNLEEFSAEDQAKIVKMQAQGRGYITRKHMAEKQAASPSAGAPAEDINDDGLPNLEEFSPEDQAKIVKMQAQGRGYITRKHMAEKKAAAPSAGDAADDNGNDELPNLEEFSAEDQAKVVKMQAQSRGYITRKHMAEKKAAAPSAGAPDDDNGNDDGLPNLEEFSAEDQAKIVKMQAQGRGYITRKHMAEKKLAEEAEEDRAAAVEDGDADLPMGLATPPLTADDDYEEVLEVFSVPGNPAGVDGDEDDARANMATPETDDYGDDDFDETTTTHAEDVDDEIGDIPMSLQTPPLTPLIEPTGADVDEP